MSIIGLFQRTNHYRVAPSITTRLALEAIANSFIEQDRRLYLAARGKNLERRRS